MIRDIIRLRGRNQITLPAEICEHLGLQEGGLLEVVLTDDRKIQMAPARLVSAFSAEGQAKIERAMADVQSGRTQEIADAGALARSLSERGKAARKAHKAERRDLIGAGSE